MRLLFFFILVLCVSQSSGQVMIDLVHRYQEDRNALVRKYSISESEQFYERLGKFYREFAAELERIEFEKLLGSDRADFVLLRNQIHKDADALAIDHNQYKEVAFVTEFALPLYEFVGNRAGGKSPDREKIAGVFSDISRKVVQVREDLKKKPFSSWQKAEKASQVVHALLSALRESHKFYNGYDPLYTWWAEKPFATLDTAMESYGKFLKYNYVNTSIRDDGSGIIGKPIGRDAIVQMLRTEFVSYSPEELVALAEKELDWCQVEMLKASGELGFGKNWKSALEAVKRTYVAPGEQPAMVNRLAQEAIKFLEDKDLISIPALAKETWRMGMMSPEAQKVNPFFLGGEEIIISYPTNTMDHDQKMMSMRGNNPHFSRATVQHELIPGHHLQQFMQSRYKPYRYIFDTPFWVEGWALYWEMNLWDKDFAKTPEDRIGMLFWRMHRCARVIFSLNYHLGKMTPKQCIDFLVDRVGHEYANAEAEVRRSFMGGYGPLYQVAYLLGGMQLYSLRNEVVKSGRMTEKQFHDRVLRENSIPIEILRNIILDAGFEKRYEASWKFAANR